MVQLGYAKMAFGLHLSTSKFYAGGPLPVFNLRLTKPIKKGEFGDIFEVPPAHILASTSLSFPKPGYIVSGLAELIHPISTSSRTG